jgi:hypothetical protein
MRIDLSGEWKVQLSDGQNRSILIPGTLDESGIGYKDIGKNAWHPASELGNAKNEIDENAPISTRFTRKHTYEGQAIFETDVSYMLPEGKRAFLEVERARCLTLKMDGVTIPYLEKPSLSTPHIFDVTDVLRKAKQDKHHILIISDNSYPGLPKKAIQDSSAATDETQTNWNGLLGFVRLRIENDVFISGIRVYPYKNMINIHISLNATREWKGKLIIKSDGLEQSACIEVELSMGQTNLVLKNRRLNEHVNKWDEFDSNLYELCVTLEEHASFIESKKVTFGVRDFKDNGKGRLTLNERIIFLRGEANCAVFPETGHTPMTVAEWNEILLRYRSYGVNCMRFHSYCPPEAAFIAADQIGMLMQPELSNWNPKDAFGSDESMNYYKDELEQILIKYANHPSFVMLTLGNELHADANGHQRMNKLIEIAHAIDSTRLIANGSNVHYGEIGCDKASDFYASQKFYEKDLRGTYSGMQGFINCQYPNAKTNYDQTMQALRKEYDKPVFTFEVGQFEVLPDFDEIDDFKGISEPANLKLIKERAKEKGLLLDWKSYVEATGALALIGYQEEIEAAMRTKDLSGISLLGLQDFPGQGTALVGMMNSHLCPKPYDFAKPEHFRKFFTDQLPMVLLEKYTYENTENIKANVIVANYGKKAIAGSLICSLKGIKTLDPIPVYCPVGELTEAGCIEFELHNITVPSNLILTVEIGDIHNSYPIWVYPKEDDLECPSNVYETEVFDAQARKVLLQGGNVFLAPKSSKEALPHSIQAQFTTDFWSVGTFADQEGGMGQLIDHTHPIFKEFPTEFHTNWQWWPMATSRAVILPKQYRCIIIELDSYAFLRPMAQLLECRCLNGKVIFSTMGLKEKQQYTECKALLKSIYHYMQSKDFLVQDLFAMQEIEPEVFEQLVV